MTEIESILEHARVFVVQHAPSDMLRHAVPFAIVCLFAGVGLSVLGAKLSRFGTACAFSVLGGMMGSYFAQQTGYPLIICGLIGALMIGVIGYQTFRLWVGLGAAMVLSTVALSLFGYQKIMPHMAEFDSAAASSMRVGAETFVLPSPEQSEAYRNRTPRQWAGELWAFVTEKDVRIERNVKALALAAMVTGLCLGVLAVRWALILSTSLIGTALVTTAVATLLNDSVPSTYQAFRGNPGLVGMGVGGFLVTSLVLQTLLTRKVSGTTAGASGKS